MQALEFHAFGFLCPTFRFFRMPGLPNCGLLFLPAFAGGALFLVTLFLFAGRSLLPRPAPEGRHPAFHFGRSYSCVWYNYRYIYFGIV
jgi:hypothetical protein